MIREIIRNLIKGCAAATHSHVLAESRLGQIDVLMETVDRYKAAVESHDKATDTLRRTNLSLTQRVDQLEGERVLLLKLVKSIAGDSENKLPPSVRKALKDL